MSFNIDSITVHDTHKLEILHPVSNKLTGAVVEIYGKDSKTFIDAYQDQQKEFLLNMAKDPSPASKESGYLFVAKCIKGWSGICENDVEIEFSIEKFIEIAKRHKWMFDQIDKALVNRKLFIKG